MLFARLRFSQTNLRQFRIRDKSPKDMFGAFALDGNPNKLSG